MKIRHFISMLILAVLVYGCSKKSDTTGPNDDPPDGNGNDFVTQPQTDIPWPSLANSPWPMFLHDPQHTSRSPLVGPQNGEFTPIGPVGGEIFSSPAITEEGYIIVGADGVYAFDASGTQVWHFDKGETRNDRVLSSACITSDGTIYIGCNNGNLYALKTDGSLKWSYDTGTFFGMESPVVSKDGSVIYFISANPYGDNEQILHAVDTTGQLLWQYETQLPSGNNSPSISPDGNTIYTTGGFALHALNLDGSLKWKYQYTGNCGPPVVDNEGNIYFNGGNYLYAINPNGTLRWSFETRFGGGNSAPCIGYDGTIYTYKIGPYGRFLVALDYAGTKMWEVDVGGYLYPNWPPSVDAQGNVYYCFVCDRAHDNKTNFIAVNADGTIKFSLELCTPDALYPDIDTSPVIAPGGVVYTGSDNARGWYMFKIR